MPTGDYKGTFSLSGLMDVDKNAQVNLVETTRLDADMKMSAVTEAITVTANQATVMETPQVQTNYKQSTVNQLPTCRQPFHHAPLSPAFPHAANAIPTPVALAHHNLYPHTVATLTQAAP